MFESGAEPAAADEAVALLIRLCNAGITGVPAARARCGAPVSKTAHSTKASHTAEDHAANHDGARAEADWRRECGKGDKTA